MNKRLRFWVALTVWLAVIGGFVGSAEWAWVFAFVWPPTYPSIMAMIAGTGSALVAAEMVKALFSDMRDALRRRQVAMDSQTNDGLSFGKVNGRHE